jgi:ribosomal protein S18 acetylase RimI-like enzyme
MQEMMRNLTERDLPAVQRLDGPLFALLTGHGDCALENTTALWQGDALLGAGCLRYHASWHAPRESGVLRKLTLSLHTPADLPFEEEERVRGLLVDALKRRAGELAAGQSGTQIAIQAYVDTEDGPVLQLLVDKGFSLGETLAVMGRDLEELPNAALPAGIWIGELKLDEAGLARYLAADAQANAGGIPISSQEIAFLSHREDFRCFVALEGDAVVGSVSVWGAEEGRGETEKVIVVPGWRRRGVAGAMLCHALHSLRGAGYDLATLTVRGSNRGALRLYTALGYTLRFLLVEMLYLPDSGRKP